MKLYNFPFKAMGSSCEVQLYSSDGIHAQFVARQVQADVQRIEWRYSRYREDSVLSAINRIANQGGSFPANLFRII